MTWDIEKLDLDAYLARIGHDGARAPSAATLRAVHRAHVTSIPFENLDVVLGRGVPIDLESLQDKLVRRRRGGYCHEHNLLFAAALERLGFRVTRHLARIRLGGRFHLARTHATLTVEPEEGGRWLADVGFGGEGLVEPLPFRDGATARLGEWAWRLGRDGDFWELRAGDTALYAFREEEPQYPSDFEVANHYVATSPRSPFTRHVLAQRTTPDTRIRIEDVMREDAGAVATAPGLVAVLRDRFGIELPERDAAELLPRLATAP
ncbi:arylamine N-acetyltransferase [Nonomuraea roseoviolacea subsp. roseoviolacea]|uniref:arylamine N-acetyltransferase family protein n=1 Tax=Nonomuraea roseoviolacea TaxID=103837 RepID=UPI0031CEBB42